MTCRRRSATVIGAVSHTGRRSYEYSLITAPLPNNLCPDLSRSRSPPPPPSPFHCPARLGEETRGASPFKTVQRSDPDRVPGRVVWPRFPAGVSAGFSTIISHDLRRIVSDSLPASRPVKIGPAAHIVPRHTSDYLTDHDTALHSDVTRPGGWPIFEKWYISEHHFQLFIRF